MLVWFSADNIRMEKVIRYLTPTVSINVPDPVLQVMEGVPFKICSC